ncbi:ERF family protein [Streptomyces sp. TRM66268-LWL]|uniref:ERF family protein n=1 Tax=Streptomyces polyasparticus TaxID=2767826 RepID=A0ABR7SEW0_9ACTN|nr:ERF family protein [Streptomyces polyasparticus]MBC9714052.1 ERF family protein [Streptomyces polyasparticus]
MTSPVPETTPRIETAYVPAPDGAPADAPRIFQVIHGVMREVMPVAKGQRNTQQNYSFRGVDDAMSAMAGPMRAHGCFIAPEVIEHRQRPRGDKGTHTVVTMLFRVFGPAGDCLLVTVPGEAMDMGDKSTNKAMSAALKYMLFQVFMIPIDARSIDDGDRDAPAVNNAPRQQQSKHQPRRAKRPRRDYLAEARKAPSPEAFAKVRAAAVADGAPAEYVAQLDQVDASKRRAAAEQRPQAPAGEEHGAAMGELFDAARSAGVTDRAEVEQLVAARHGVKPAEATLEQLREMRDDLLDAARGARA